MKYSTILKEKRPCPFCNIQNNEIIEENNNAFVILNRGPYTKYHIMIISKIHYHSLYQLNEEETKDLFSLVKKYTKVFYDNNFNNAGIIIRDGKLDSNLKSGKTIEHLHIHILPERKIGDVLFEFELKEQGTINRKFLDGETYNDELNEFKEKFLNK